MQFFSLYKSKSVSFPNQQATEGGLGDSSGDRSDEDEEGRSGEETKNCSNCTIPATILNESPKGPQCQTCYNHWK